MLLKNLPIKHLIYLVFFFSIFSLLFEKKTHDKLVNEI